MLPQHTIPEYRRNGKIPSCEPCRISKLRCDHEQPICQRCRRRAKTCTYHPAPMTKRHFGAALAPPATSPLVRAASAPSTAINGNTDDNETNIARAPDGYLGETSILAPLCESQHVDADCNDYEHDAMMSRKLSFRDDCRVEMGVQVLKTVSLALVQHELSEHRPCNMAARTPAAILKKCWASLTITLGAISSTADPISELRTLSRLLFDNTAKPLPLPGQRSMEEYADTFIASLIRWETVAVVTAAFSLARGTQDPTKRNNIEELSKPPSWRALIDTTNICVNFCDETGSVNDVLMWILTENTVVQTLFYGDASYNAWKWIGDLSSCLFALGLHLEIRITPEVPRWLAQLRQHMVLFAYMIDKSIAVFVGRPPRISQRYVRLDAPMCLDNKALALPVDELEALIAKRGDRAYDVDLSQSFSMYYANKNCYICREEILELFLGTPGSISTEDMRIRTASIAQRSRTDWENVPPKMRYDTSIRNSDRPPGECYSLNVVYLDHLYNNWLLQRVIVQRLHGDSFELLRLSGDLLTHGLAVVTQAGGNIGWVISDLPWSIMLFCLPAAGVLILELLRQAQTHNYSSNAFSRSTVIQNLSILISTLEWVARPGIGNYELCRQAHFMLKRSMDRILDPGVMAQEHTQAPATQPTGLITPDASGVQSSAAMSDVLLDWSPEQWLSADPSLEFWSNLEDHGLMMFNSTDAFWPKAQGGGF